MDQHIKELEAQLRDKRKRDTNEEAGHANTAPPAQKLCFNLEHEMGGSDLLDALSDVGPAAQLADISREEAQSFDRSESFNKSESESESESVPEPNEFDSTFQSDESKAAFAKCKKRGGKNRSQPKEPTSNSRRESKGRSAKTSKASEDSSPRWYSYLRRLPYLLLALLVACLAQLGNAAEVMFGNAFGNIIFDSFAFFTTKFSQCVPQHNNRRVVSGAVLL